MVGRFFLLVFLALAMAAPQAFAQEIDAKAETLKSQIEDILSGHQRSLKLRGHDLQTKGKIDIEEAGGYYAVTLPHLTAVNNDGSKVEIGMIALNAVPGENEGEWKLSAALPTPIVWMDKDGDLKKRIHFGQQKFSGTWSPGLENFSSLNAQYDNVEINYIDRAETLFLGKLFLTADLKTDKDDLWLGPIRAEMNDVKIAKADKDPNLKAAQINFGLKLDGFSPKKQKDAREKIEAYAEHSGPEDLLSMEGEERAALFNILTDLLKSSGNSFAFSTGVRNLSSITEDGTIQIEKGFLNLVFSGLNSDQLSLNLMQETRNLSLQKKGQDVSGLTPEDTKINIAFDNIPLEGLLDLIRSNLSGTDNKTARQLARIQTMLVLPQLFSKSGSTLSIKDTMLKNSLYDASAYGQIQANKDAALGMAGDFTISLAGLDEMIKTMQDNKKSVSPEKQILADKTIQRLTLLSALGQESKTADDKTARIYKFEIKDSGEVLLNGTDFSVLMKSD